MQGWCQMHYCCKADCGIWIWLYPCLHRVKGDVILPLVLHYCMHIAPFFSLFPTMLFFPNVPFSGKQQNNSCLSRSFTRWIVCQSLNKKLNKEQNSGVKKGPLNRSACHLICVCLQVHCFYTRGVTEKENADLCAYYCALSPTSQIRPRWQGVSTHHLPLVLHSTAKRADGQESTESCDKTSNTSAKNS